MPKPEFKSRKEFMDRLADMMTLSYEEKRAIAEFGGETRGHPPELKTYIMESNNGVGEINKSSFLMISQNPTDLPQITILTLKHAGKSATFYVDATDPRFLVFYTNDLAEYTDPLYRRLVLSADNRFDRIWLATEILDEISHLAGNVFRGFGLRFDDLFAPERTEEQPIHELRMSVAGRSSAEALDALGERETLRRSLSYSKIRVLRGNGESFVSNDIRFTGRLITRAGDSIDDYVSLVETIRKIYRKLIEEIERNSIGTKRIENRTLIEGQAFDLVLEREIEDLDQFVNILVRPTYPFRLWGLKNKIFEDVRQIVAVDLHTGDPIDLEVSPSLVRIYLPKGACGNTVLRLYVNLQHTFDSAIRYNGEKLPQID